MIGQAGMIRVVLADDHPVFLSGLARVLDAQPDVTVVGTAEDGKQALEVIDSLRPDIAILDARMPVLDGRDTLRLAREEHPDLKALFVSGYADERTVRKALEAGARGFVIKSVPPEEIYVALQKITQGDIPLPPGIAQTLTEITSGPHEVLTLREQEILQVLVDGRSNAEIGNQLHVSEATVKTHLNHVYAKLGVRSRPAAVTEAIRRGLVRL